MIGYTEYKLTKKLLELQERINVMKEEEKKERIEELKKLLAGHYFLNSKEIELLIETAKKETAKEILDEMYLIQNLWVGVGKNKYIELRLKYLGDEKC